MSERLQDVRCECGAALMDVLEFPDVVVEGRRFPFRRTTDHVICPTCWLSYRVTDLDVPPAEVAPDHEEHV